MSDFKKTERQRQAIDLLNSAAKHILLFGGSRSGKSFIILRNLILRSLKTKSRHVALRRHFSHIKQSVWFDTLPKVLSLCFPQLVSRLKWNQSDWFLQFPNGSELWLGGLDDKERTEKILGKEFSTIFFNECSEISYDSRNIALTRLAERNELKKKVFYDCNPPRPSHWTHKLFIEKVDPISEQPLLIPDDYASLLMNPLHNMENIDPDYIDGVLRQLPFALRKRFLDGEFFSDDSDIFQPQWIRPGLTGDYDMIISTCDPAISEKKTADEAAICTIGIAKDGKAEEIETIHGRWGFDGLISNLHAVEARHKPDYAGVESVAFQKSVAAVLRRDNPATRWRGLDEFGVRSDVDKVRRSISISYLLERGVATVNTPALSKQLLEFEGGDEKNDLVDAYVYALQLYQRVWNPKPVEQEHVIVSYDERVRRYLDNRRKSMTKAKQGEGKDPFLGSRW